MEPNFSSITILRNKPYRYTTSCRNAALFVVQHQCDIDLPKGKCKKKKKCCESLLLYMYVDSNLLKF